MKRYILSILICTFFMSFFNAYSVEPPVYDTNNILNEENFSPVSATDNATEFIPFQSLTGNPNDPNGTGEPELGLLEANEDNSFKNVFIFILTLSFLVILWKRYRLRRDEN